MRNLKRIFFRSTLCVAFVCCSLFAASFEINSQINVSVIDVGTRYIPSKINSDDDLPYPTSAKQQDAEAFIDLLYDVNANGIPENIRFSNAFGTDVFLTLAEKRMSSWKGTPAMASGKPIKQKNIRTSFMYSLTRQTTKFPEPLVRRSFARVYNSMKEDIKNHEFERLKEKLDLLGQARLIRFSEHRRYWLVRDSYLSKTDGALVERIYALKQALKDVPRKESTKKLHAKIKANLVKLYSANEHYSEVINSFYQLKQLEFSEPLTKGLVPLFEAAKKALSDKEDLAVEILSDQTGYITHQIYRHSFTLSANGPIGDVEIQCRDFNIAFPYKNDARYKIPSELLGCSVSLLTDPKTLLIISESDL